MVDRAFDRSVAATLVATLVDVITPQARCSSLRVFNRGAADIWARTDGVDPTVGGADSLIVPAGQDRVFAVLNVAAPEVRLISAGAVLYSVETN